MSENNVYILMILIRKSEKKLNHEFMDILSQVFETRYS